MNVRSLSMNVSQKVNLGNYETKGISLGVSAELDESDDLAECKAELATKLNQLLEEEVKKKSSKLQLSHTAGAKNACFFLFFIKLLIFS